MGHESGLPNHVLRYLRRIEVDPSDLSDEARETLAGLSVGELGLLETVKNSMKDDDDNVMLRVH